MRWGTRPGQRTVRATLATLADHDLAAPSTIVVGDVAARAAALVRGPAAVRSPRRGHPRQGAGRFPRGRLVAAGAEVVEAPTIEIAEPADGGAALRDAIARIDEFDWVVLSSPNGVDRFTELLRDGRDLAGVRLAVVGPGTQAALAERGLVADLVPDRYVAEGLLEAFPDPDPGGSGRVLVVRAAVGRDVLVDGLAARGWEVEVVEAYRTVPATFDDATRDRLAGADAITFTSSSSVKSFVDGAGVAAVPPVVVTIGPITSATARELGLEVTAEADPHSLDGLVAAVSAQLAREGDGGRSPRIDP